METLADWLNWLLGPESRPKPAQQPTAGILTAPLEESQPSSTHLYPRWLFLRAIGLIYFSAFYSLIFQIKGLIGPQGILPASELLHLVPQYFPGLARFWYAPTLLWFSSSNRALEIICWAGLISSILVIFNIWPRAALLICFVTFLSFVSAARDFSGYQSDGMLLEAGFICLFFAPPGLRPGLARSHAPSRASLFLLRWEWFRIYFESGVVKLASGDRSWRSLTAMDDYYQNGPLPTWIGWYAHQLPHWFHASTVVLTLGVELVIVWMLFLPRRFRIICFCIVTPFEAGIILTANYTFLNYLVLSLGILLVDDKFLEAVLPTRFREFISGRDVRSWATKLPAKLRSAFSAVKMSVAGLALGMVFYVTSAILIQMFIPGIPFPEGPMRWLDPFRIANRYGLFANMTHERYEIEFQGTRDGKTWIPYPFRYKPQDLTAAPGIYAPYQPRFEWNLWFASLDSWRRSPFVVATEEQILKGSPDVLALFASDPFKGDPPKAVRAIIYQYWFTDRATKRAEGTWWRRDLLGRYCPALIRTSDGEIAEDDSEDLSPIVHPPIE
ncbi:MAG: lipase maturation factor family protein [Candidatus Acidiferrales bacterium]